MLKRAFLASCTTLFLAYAPIAPAASAAVVGQVNPHGTVLINGTIAPTATTVFSGDKISSEENTSAVFSFAGGDQLLLGPMSTAVANNNSNHVMFSLQDGVVSVVNKANDPITVAAGGARITPSGNTASVYEVSLHGKSLLVTARRGTALVETANKTVEVKEGMAFDATMAAPQAGGSGLTRAETFGIAVAVVAGVAGVALGAAALSNQTTDPRNCTVNLSSSTGQITCP